MNQLKSHKSFISNTVKTFASAGFAALACSSGAAEISTDPGDYVALPPGVNLGIVYYQHTEHDAYYVNSNKTQGSFKLVTDIGLARFVHYMKIGDYVIDPQIVIPFGKVNLNTPFGPLAPVSANGVADPIIGSALWLMNRPEQQQWFAVSGFASLPLGNYDPANGPVNLGENRWKGIFQAAYTTALGKSFMLDVVGEYAIYGNNNNFLGLTKKQDASYGVQTHLRYVISPATYVGLSYYRDFGGESSLNGISQNDRMNNSRWLATLASFVTPTVQLQIQAGRALKVANGAEDTNQVNLRLVKVF
ncbi:transporter [Glaciimonas sp. PAMC28666]|uniref:transporter n=1 Tax=Glaciimonas sp. PAMC28666 TaxID=2807626 RepID=UPI001962AD94|nr:transporter [Glaciimonas sp. PAMC28666]QRX81673.1 transporter [Glaciimonas sp. PAMC28666]